MPRTDITIQCKICGEHTNKPAYCPYTGHRHSNGWQYKCKCGGDMIEVSYREGGACAFLVPEPGEPWVTVKTAPITGRVTRDEPNFIQLSRNRKLKGNVAHQIQVKKYVGGNWETKATAYSEGLAVILFTTLTQFKGYGDQVRVRRDNPETGKVVTTHES